MNSDAREILKNNELGVLATVNADGSAWATTLHIFSDDEAVYWFSSAEAQHTKNIDKNPSVSLTVFSPDKSEGLKSVSFNGRAEVLSGDDRQYVVKIAQQKMGQLPVAFADYNTFKLPIGRLDEDKSWGKCWYFYI